MAKDYVSAHIGIGEREGEMADFGSKHAQPGVCQKTYYSARKAAQLEAASSPEPAHNCVGDLLVPIHDRAPDTELVIVAVSLDQRGHQSDVLVGASDIDRHRRSRD